MKFVTISNDSPDLIVTLLKIVLPVTEICHYFGSTRSSKFASALKSTSRREIY